MAPPPAAAGPSAADMVRGWLWNRQAELQEAGSRCLVEVEQKLTGRDACSCHPYQTIPRLFRLPGVGPAGEAEEETSECGGRASGFPGEHKYAQGAGPCSPFCHVFTSSFVSLFAEWPCWETSLCLAHAAWTAETVSTTRVRSGQEIPSAGNGRHSAVSAEAGREREISGLKRSPAVPLQTPCSTDPQDVRGVRRRYREEGPPGPRGDGGGGREVREEAQRQVRFHQSSILPPDHHLAHAPPKTPPSGSPSSRISSTTPPAASRTSTGRTTSSPGSATR